MIEREGVDGHGFGELGGVLVRGELWEGRVGGQTTVVYVFQVLHAGLARCGFFLYDVVGREFHILQGGRYGEWLKTWGERLRFFFN